MNKSALPPWVQIAFHLGFVVFATANNQGLIPDDHAGKWATTIATSLQTVLAIYGIFTPSPNGGTPQKDQKQPSGKPR
jgi:hypothetical protein